MKTSVLILGDVVTLLLVTFVGFVIHDRLEAEFLARAAALTIPLLIAWFALASRLGLFEQATFLNPRQLWRPAVAMIAAVPLAIVVRAAILSVGITPLFILALGAISALGITLWRGLFLWFARRAS